MCNILKLFNYYPPPPKKSFFKAMTTCFLGFYKDFELKCTLLPRTGTCVNLRTCNCACNYPNNCITNGEGWGVCPYCRVRIFFVTSKACIGGPVSFAFNPSVVTGHPSKC